MYVANNCFAAGYQKTFLNARQFGLHSFISHSNLGAATGQGSSSLTWTDPASGREFVATGIYKGTGLLEIDIQRWSVDQAGILTFLRPNQLLLIVE
ncbi:hypothetical protein BJ878DRAFT_539866 [Calycina marina]|uniref:Uncharacterized protein n=1 Tax=Calycina marina TaxID=1763456 RepID=A0A9P7Z8F5_9HELO|nr:hypothetical protein BJ878DRAFT_539866 [Calycina marina]